MHNPIREFTRALEYQPGPPWRWARPKQRPVLGLVILLGVVVLYFAYR